MREADVVLVGGHSVEDDELKYGLSVTGLIHPEKVWKNKGAMSGDKLILTKPLGTGIINTALKGEMADKDLVAKSIRCMSALNRKAAELMAAFDIHSCTDVTGFGFLGHACEMIEGTEIGMVIYSSTIPFFEEVQGLVEMGMVPGGLHRNREYRMHMVEVSQDCTEWMVDVLFDPQTSGGLLFSLPSWQAEELLKALHREGLEDAAIVGELVESHRGRIVLK